MSARDVVVVGVDNEPRDGGMPPALAWAIRFVRDSGGTLVVTHARGLLASMQPTSLRCVDEATAQLRAFAIPHRSIVHLGDPVSVLLGAAASERASLLVVGSRAHRTVPETLGSTSAQLVQRSVIPVVVVPPEYVR